MREIEQMAIPLLLWLLLCLLAPTFISSSPVQDPELVVEEVHKYIFIEKPHFFNFNHCTTFILFNCV